MNQKSVTNEENIQNIHRTTQMDDDLLEFTINGIISRNPEVLKSLSDLGIICDNSQTRINPVKLNINHLSNLNIIASIDQQIINKIQPHISHGYETGTEDLIQFDKRISNIDQNITMEIKNPKTLQTINKTHLSFSNPGHLQNSQGLLQNFESENTTQCINILSRRNDLVPRNIEIANTVHIYNVKRNLSTYSMVTDHFQDHKRYRGEIWRTSGQNNATYYETDDMSYNFKSEKCVTSQMELEHHHSAVIGQKFPNIKESPSDNRGMQNPDDIGKKTPFTFGRNTESDIGFSEIAQNDNAPNMTSDSVPSKRASCWSVDNIAVAGPSGFRTANTSNLCGEAFQSFYQHEILSMKHKKENVLACRVCKAEIANHAIEKNIFKCCVCLYHNCKEAILQMHSYTHVPKRICNICEKEHPEGNLHDSEHTCIVCQKKFQCRTQLYEHFLDHDYYFKRHCWVCSRAFYDHFTKEDGYISYLCCVCGFTNVQEGSFETHNLLHLPKFFCKLCREDYSEEEKGWHDREVTCFECPQRFKCATQLEDHSKHHDEFFSVRCILCKQSLTKHIIRHEEKKNFLCCYDKCLKRIDKKITFLNHLYSHTGLRAFKCKICRRRFPSANALGGHSRFCIELPYKCYICETRFSSIDFLQAHCLVKHSQA